MVASLLICTTACSTKSLNRQLKEADPNLPSLKVPSDYRGITNAPPLR